MKIFRNFGISLLILFIFFSIGLAKEIDMQSKTLEYDESGGYVTAQSSVTVVWKENILNADRVDFYVKKKTLTATGHVILNDGKNVLKGDRLDYDYNKETGILENVTGYSEPWYFRAKKAIKTGKDNYELKDVYMTSCDYDEKEYHVKATTAKVKAGRRITAYNPVMYFRSIPFFYLPIFPYATGSHRDSLEIMPGYDNTNGIMCKVIYGYPFTPELVRKIIFRLLRPKGHRRRRRADLQKTHRKP